LAYARHHPDKEGWPTRPHEEGQERAGRDTKRTHSKTEREPSTRDKRNADAAAGTTQLPKHFTPLPKRKKKTKPPTGHQESLEGQQSNRQATISQWTTTIQKGKEWDDECEEMWLKLAETMVPAVEVDAVTNERAKEVDKEQNEEP
jgi:hypothetical protein